MSMTTMVPNRSAAPATPSRGIWKAGIVAGVMATVVNALVFAGSVAAGVFPSFTFQAGVGAQMSVEPILLVSMVGTLAGIGAFTLLRRRSARPVPTFMWIAAVVLLLSFAAPFAIPGTALAQALVLNLLHVVVAGFVVGAVLRQ
jgi:hypothetical protein